MTNETNSPASPKQPYAIDGVVYAIARKDQREAYVMFDTPAQANGFVEYMRRFIEKPEVASRDAGGAASGGQGEPTAFSPCPFCQHKDVGFARGTPDHFGGWDIRSDSQFVKCESCGAEGPPADWDEEARRLWNSRSSIQRAPTPPTDKELLDLAEGCNFSVWNRELYLKVVRAALGWRPKTAALSAAPPSPHPDHTGSEAVAPEAKPTLQDYQDSVMAMFAAVGYTEEYARQWPKEKVSVTFKRWFDEQISRAAAPPAPPAPLPGKESERDFLLWAFETLIELNPSNYDHDDACACSAASVEVMLAIKKRVAALSSPPTLEAAPADYPPHLADEVERELALMIDRCPEPLRRLSDWLANKLDEDDWKTAERLLLGAVESVADRAQRSGVSADPLPRPLLTDLEIQGLRRQARNDPRCADQHWFILMVRAIESYYGVTGAAAQSQPLVEPTVDTVSLSLGPVAFQFTSHQRWVNKAQSWFANLAAENPNAARKRYLCIDAKGRVCMIGSDFGRARDEDAFPVKLYLIDAAQLHQVKKGEPS